MYEHVRLVARSREWPEPRVLRNSTLLFLSRLMKRARRRPGVDRAGLGTTPRGCRTAPKPDSPSAGRVGMEIGAALGGAALVTAMKLPYQAKYHTTLQSHFYDM